MGAWEDGKPIYGRLPGENSGYTKDEDFDDYDPIVDPPIARWLTEFWDEFLTDTRYRASHLYASHLNPETAYRANLDWLAQLSGFTGDYWNATWHEYFKRSLIANSFNFIWPNKGTKYLFSWLFGLFGYNALIFQLGEFLAGINVAGDTLGGKPLQYYVVVSLSYLRTSEEWNQIELLNRIYGPVYQDSRVCYNAFYAGFSVAGDPVFEPGQFGSSPEFAAAIPQPNTPYLHLIRMINTPVGIRPVMPSDGVSFVATDGQTVFTLPSAPAIPEATEASLNGIRAVYERDFSINGAILTWLEDFPLVAGDEVEVSYYV
jgi:hypothetical protein